MSTTKSQTQDPTVSAEPVFGSNAMTVLEHRYLMRSDDGQVVEAPTELLRRVARVVAATEKRWDAADDDAGREDLVAVGGVARAQQRRLA